MTLSPRGKLLLEEFEGRRLKKYQDSGSKWTIGVGHLILPGENFDSGITEEQCDALLTRDVEKKVVEVQPLLLRQPTQNEFDAIMCLVFNIGVGRHDGVKGDFADSDIRTFFNAGYTGLAADEFPKWCKVRVNGVLVENAGVKARREKERLLFLGRL